MKFSISLKSIDLKSKLKKYCIISLTLPFVIGLSTAFAAEDKLDDSSLKNEQNTSLSDPRVGERFIPIAKSTFDDTVLLTFLDRKSITLHPFNNKIRQFNEVITYGPPRWYPTVDDKALHYRSSIKEHKANCDQMEMATGIISYFENYFGEGVLQNSDSSPRRWQKPAKGNEEYQLLLIACSLPLSS